MGFFHHSGKVLPPFRRANFKFLDLSAAIYYFHGGLARGVEFEACFFEDLRDLELLVVSEFSHRISESLAHATQNFRRAEIVELEIGYAFFKYQSLAFG